MAMTRRQARWYIVGLALVAGLGAVAWRTLLVRPAPVTPPAAIASPVLTPVPVATPGMTLPDDALPRSATVEKNGVRVTFELERNPMPAGEATWATSTVTNIGDDDVTWFHDGCAVAVNTWGPAVGARWRPGREHVGIAGEYKSFTLDQAGTKDGTVLVAFTPEAFVGRKGTYGCTDIGIGDVLKPGASITEKARWSGVAGELLGPPPTGAVALTASFRYYWREARGEPEDITSELIDVPVPVWIDGTGGAILHPAEAIDVALLDPRFIAVLESRDFRNANEPIIRFDSSASVWQVGLLDHGEQPRVHLVLIDGVSGQNVGFLERDWDFDVDGFP